MQVGRAQVHACVHLVRVARWGRGHDDIKLPDFEIKFNYHT